MPDITRRGFLAGLGAGLIVAPAIVSAANIMPVSNRWMRGQWEGVRFISDEPLTVEHIRRAIEVMERNNIQPSKDGFYTAVAGMHLPDGTLIYQRPGGRKVRFYGDLERALAAERRFS